MKYKPQQYQVVDIVVYRLNLVRSKTKNVTAKQMMRRSMPMVIAKIARPNMVLLANPDTGVVSR